MRNFKIVGGSDAEPAATVNERLGLEVARAVALCLAEQTGDVMIVVGHQKRVPLAVAAPPKVKP